MLVILKEQILAQKFKTWWNLFLPWLMMSLFRFPRDLVDPGPVGLGAIEGWLCTCLMVVVTVSGIPLFSSVMEGSEWLVSIFEGLTRLSADKCCLVSKESRESSWSRTWRKTLSVGVSARIIGLLSTLFVLADFLSFTSSITYTHNVHHNYLHIYVHTKKNNAR